VILDTGPLISLIDEQDQHHSWVQSQFSNIEPPLLACEAVLTEACFLAGRAFGSAETVLRLIDRGVLLLAFSLAKNWTEVRTLLRRYADVPMSLADACLVRMSELTADCVVLTLDSDFRVYRRHGRKTIPLLMPPHD
jgi:predicted nucleic acid-binding protein